MTQAQTLESTHKANHEEGREGAYILYDCLLYFAGFIVLPWVGLRWLLSPRFRKSMRGRLGSIQEASVPQEGCVLLHGVSVGEVKAMHALLERIVEHYPREAIVISTTTPGGRETAKKCYPDIPVVQFPLDYPFACRRFLQRIQPRAVLLMELEIWPNFLRACSRSKVPVAIVNGRITKRSMSRYLRVQRLLPQFDRIALYGVQNERYAERFRTLDVPPDRIVVTGNLKYDNLPLAPHDTNRSTTAAPWSTWLQGRRSVALGSTHAPEEMRILTAAAQTDGLPDILWIVVPRHPDRAPKLQKELQDAFPERPVSLRSRQDETQPLARNAILVVDTFGELEAIYRTTTLAFLGGSLIPHGGQNVLEAAAWARPVLVGPHTDNFEEEVELLQTAGGLRRAEDATSLIGFMAEWLQNPDAGAEAGEAGRAALAARRGASLTTLQALKHADLLP